MKNKFIFMTSAVCMGLLLSFSEILVRAEASDGEEYITISVDATDDNAGLMYALDTDDPEAFTSNNEFVVPAGTSHTIYVKDSAGNITSQNYDTRKETSVSVDTEDESDSDNRYSSSKYEYLTDTPVELGEGSIHDKTTTDGSDTAEKVFYTITTAEGDTFYLVMDQNRGSDNVYLLNQVTNSELKSLAVDDTGIQQEKENEQNLLEQLKTDETVDMEEAAEKDTSSQKGALAKVLVLAAIGAGGYYYFKVYRKKKNTELDVADAMDMDDFEAEDDDEIFFDEEYSEEEKERYLQELIESDDVYEDEIVSEEAVIENSNPDDAISDSEVLIEQNTLEENSGIEEQGFLEEPTDYDPELDGEEEEE